MFGDANGLDWDDVAHSDRERRFKRLGFSMDKRLLLVVYTMRRMGHEKEKIRIISARQATAVQPHHVAPVGGARWRN